jgi:hypothetical protein
MCTFQIHNSVIVNVIYTIQLCYTQRICCREIFSIVEITWRWPLIWAETCRDCNENENKISCTIVANDGFISNSFECWRSYYFITVMTVTILSPLNVLLIYTDCQFIHPEHVICTEENSKTNKDNLKNALFYMLRIIILWRYIMMLEDFENKLQW